MKEKSNRLPDSELAVMQVIWELETPIGSGAIVSKMEEEKGWTRSTTQVLLNRLEEKNYLTSEKNGRLKLYTPAIEKEDYINSETKSFLENFYQNSFKGLIASLVKEEKITEDDIDEIIAIIKKK